MGSVLFGCIRIGSTLALVHLICVGFKATSHSAIFDIPVPTADSETCNAWAVNFDLKASDAPESLKLLSGN